MTTPSVFVSYSHDDLDHKRWVLDLSTRLRKSGVDVILDQWDLDAGDDLGSFMTSNLKSADRVLMVCTPNYVNKANEGKGGAGVERMIMTAEYLSNIDSNKVIPVIKKHGAQPVPDFFETKLYIDFSSTDEYEASFDDLLRSLLGKPLFQKPEIGTNPFGENVEQPSQPTHDPVKDLIALLVNFYEKHGRAYIHRSDIHRSKIASSKTMTDLIINRACVAKLIFKGNDGNIWLEDKGKEYAIENEIIS